MKTILQVYFYKDLKLGWIFDTSGHEASLTFFMMKQYCNIINANVVAHTYVVQNSRNMFKQIQSVLIEVGHKFIFKTLAALRTC